MDKIGFIGAGNMAEAIIRGVILAHVYEPANIFISDVRAERIDKLSQEYGVRTAQTNPELVSQVNILVLSVKPQTLHEALQSIAQHVNADTLVISIVAGKHIDTITQHLGDVAVVRVMPNTPALIGEGASALYANDRARAKMEKARAVFLCVGKSIIVQEESLLDAVTAVSGSGPAYYFLFIEEMIKAGVDLGLSYEVSKSLVLQTAKGAALLAELADSNGETPQDLSKKVATPGGTTEAALDVFREKKLGDTVAAAVRRACARSQELSQG